MHTPAGDPPSVIVRAGPCPKAPGFRCRHLGKVGFVHWASAVHGMAGGPWKVGANCWPQNPQKTNGCALRSWEVLLCDPVERLNGIGRAPMLAVAAGGQSWLVGKAAPSDAELPGVQGWPAFGPAWQVVGVPAQRGHGMSPSVGPVR